MGRGRRGSQFSRVWLDQMVSIALWRFCASREGLILERGWVKLCDLTVFLCTWSSTCQIRELYKQRLDEFEMLERHLIQASARSLAEKERAVHQAKVQMLEPFIKMSPGMYKELSRACHPDSLAVNMLLYLLHCSLSSLSRNIWRASYRHDVSWPQNTLHRDTLQHNNPPSQEISIGATLSSSAQIPFTFHQLAHSGSRGSHVAYNCHVSFRLFIGNNSLVFPCLSCSWQFDFFPVLFIVVKWA